MDSAGDIGVSSEPERKSRMWLTAAQEHAITELLGPQPADGVQIAPGLFADDPVSLTFAGSGGRRTYLISADGRAWPATERGEET